MIDLAETIERCQQTFIFGWTLTSLVSTNIHLFLPSSGEDSLFDEHISLTGLKPPTCHWTAFEIIGILGLQPVVEISVQKLNTPNRRFLGSCFFCFGSISITHFPDHFAAQTSWKLEIFWDHFGILSWWTCNDKNGGKGLFWAFPIFSRWWFHVFCLFSHLFGEDSHFDEHVFQSGVQPRSSFGYRWCFLYFRYLKWLINILGCPILDLFNLIFTDCTMVHHIALPFLRICLELFPIISSKSKIFNDLAHWKGSPFMPAINPLQFI